jgi:acetylornithine/succinyldiaminopimelate/putrescine aminotransferase
MLEPIQGESGIYPLGEETLLAAREACDAVGALLIFDEIQTGMGRTGSLWAYQQTPVRPDLLTSAKALGGGLPVGACIAAERLSEVLEPGDHGSTFAGGAVGSAAALAVLDVVDDPALLRRVRELGAGLREGLLALEGVDEVRGRGLMLGVGLASGIDAAEVGAGLLDRGLIVNVPEPGTLRLLPPLTVDSAQIERAVALIGESLLSYSPA